MPITTLKIVDERIVKPGGDGLVLDFTAVESAGHALLGKSTTGTGAAEAIALATNSVVGRSGSGNISAIGADENSVLLRAGSGPIVFGSADENTIVGRPTGDVLRTVAPNDFWFQQGDTYTKAGYVHSESKLASPSAYTNFEYEIADPLGDGSYSFAVDFVAVTPGGTRYYRSYALQIERVAGEFVGAQLAAPYEPGSAIQDSEIEATFFDDEGLFYASMQNTTGDNLQITCSFALVYKAFPVTPETSF